MTHMKKQFNVLNVETLSERIKTSDKNMFTYLKETS